MLLSGGLDSATCAAFYLSRREPVTALFVDYGQPAAAHERRAAATIARRLGFPLLTRRLSPTSYRSVGLVQGRNAYLLLTALLEVVPTPRIIALGIHAGTPYADCSPRFVDVCQGLLDLYTGGSTRIAAPFVDWPKANIYRLALDLGLPIDATYSCERGSKPPCARCASCMDRKALHARA